MSDSLGLRCMHLGCRIRGAEGGSHTSRLILAAEAGWKRFEDGWVCPEHAQLPRRRWFQKGSHFTLEELAGLPDTHLVEEASRALREIELEMRANGFALQAETPIEVSIRVTVVGVPR